MGIIAVVVVVVAIVVCGACKWMDFASNKSIEAFTHLRCNAHTICAASAFNVGLTANWFAIEFIDVTW